MKDKLMKNLLAKYRGKWIGVKDNRVIAVSEVHREIYKKLKEKGISGVYVFYSPTPTEEKYGFLFLVQR